MRRSYTGWVWCAGLTLFVLWVHLCGYTTSMIDFQTADYNLERDYIANRFLAETVEIHRSHPVFSRRPMVTWLIDSSSSALGVDIANAYVIVQFTLMFLSGVLLYYLSRSILYQHRHALLSVLGYYLSFTIIFAFFSTNYTYDNLLQYGLAFGALLLLYYRKLILGSLLFGVSIYAHESGLFILPGIYVLLQNHSRSSKVLVVLGSLAFYLLLLGITIDTELRIIETSETLWSRLKLYQFNFQDWRYTVESFFSILLAVGVPTYLLWAFKNKRPAGKTNVWHFAYWLSLLICIPIFLFLAKARESRLFATALIFLWPIMGPYIEAFWKELRIQNQELIKIRGTSWLLLIAGIAILAAVISYVVYQQTGQWPNSNLHNEFLFLASFALLLHYFGRKLYAKYVIEEP